MDEGTKNQRIKVIFSERIGPDSHSSVLSSHHDGLKQVPQPQEEVIPLEWIVPSCFITFLPTLSLCSIHELPNLQCSYLMLMVIVQNGQTYSGPGLFFHWLWVMAVKFHILPTLQVNFRMWESNGNRKSSKFSNAYRSSYLFPKNNWLQKTQLHLTQSRTVGALYRDAATPTTFELSSSERNFTLTIIIERNVGYLNSKYTHLYMSLPLDK